MWYKVWSVFLFIAAIAWFFNAIEVLTGRNEFTDFTLVVAFVTTGFVVTKWGIEAWNDGER